MAWTAHEIPLKPFPQSLSVTLAGVVYQLTVRWNSFVGSWVLDIANESNEPLAQGIPLLTGQDLLAQYAYLQIGGKLIVQTDLEPYSLPTKTNLGINSHLYFMVSA